LRDYLDFVSSLVDFELNAIEPAANQMPGLCNPGQSGLDHEHKQPLNKSQPGQLQAHLVKMAICFPANDCRQRFKKGFPKKFWIPAYAGMTGVEW